MKPGLEPKAGRHGESIYTSVSLHYFFLNFMTISITARITPIPSKI